MPYRNNDYARRVMIIMMMEMMTTTKHLHMLVHKYTLVGVKFNSNT